MKRQYDSIQLMRGLAAITVVFMHIQMVQNGAFGVELFFCISGFIMMHVTQKESSHFLLKRVIRIVPLYWAAILATTVLLVVFPTVFRTVVFTPEYFLKSMFFIPYFYAGASSLVQVGWTLVLEMFFYLIFFVAMKIKREYRHLITSAILMVMVAVRLIFIDNTSVFINFYCQPVILSFALGMLSYRFLVPGGNTTDSIELRPWVRVICVASAALIWAGLFSLKYIPQLELVDRFWKYGIPAFAVFVLLFKGLENVPIPRPFVVLGNISYSIYLTHSFVVQGFSRLVFDIDTFSIPGVVLICVAVLPLVVAVGWVSWWVVENKFTAFLRKKLIK